MVAYLSKAGVAPYDGEGITATQIYFPGPPSVAVAFLRALVLKEGRRLRGRPAVGGRLCGRRGAGARGLRYEPAGQQLGMAVSVRSAVEVEVRDGVVLLSGAVSNETQAERALTLAEQLPDVVAKLKARLEKEYA